MIEIPYTIAFVMACFFVCVELVKNVTVIGIIGNTQGVFNAVIPARNAKKRNTIKLVFSPDLFPLSFKVNSAATTFFTAAGVSAFTLSSIESTGGLARLV